MTRIQDQTTGTQRPVKVCSTNKNTSKIFITTTNPQVKLIPTNKETSIMTEPPVEHLDRITVDIVVPSFV